MEVLNNTIACINMAVGLIVIGLLATHQELIRFPRPHKMLLWAAGAGLVYQAIDYFAMAPRYSSGLLLIPVLSYSIIVASLVDLSRAGIKIPKR